MRVVAEFEGPAGSEVAGECVRECALVTQAHVFSYPEDGKWKVAVGGEVGQKELGLITKVAQKVQAESERRRAK